MLSSASVSAFLCEFPVCWAEVFIQFENQDDNTGCTGFLFFATLYIRFHVASCNRKRTGKEMKNIRKSVPKQRERSPQFIGLLGRLTDEKWGARKVCPFALGQVVTCGREEPLV